jgi:hypothetical protein
MSVPATKRMYGIHWCAVSEEFRRFNEQAELVMNQSGPILTCSEAAACVLN